MCVAPNRLPDGTQVACRGCWQCRENRLNDLVGRCLAEQHISDQTLAFTLTYCGDTPNAAYLCYQDVQHFLKRLRNAGYAPRYICAGEYGSKKGRAHWHLVLFLSGKVLDIVDADERKSDWQVVLPRFDNDDAARIQFAPWSAPSDGRGFVYVQHPDFGGFRYLMKYALKDQASGGSARCLSMSKKPPLGFRFFMEMADDLVDRRLPVQAPSYQFMRVSDGELHREFWLQGRMRELFLDRFRTMWRLRFGEVEPHSDWYDEHYAAKVTKAVRDADTSRLEADIEAKRRAFYRIEPFPEEDQEPVGAAVAYLVFSDRRRKCIVTVMRHFEAVWADLLVEDDRWNIGSGSCENVAAQLRQVGLLISNAKQVSAWLSRHFEPGQS